MTPARYRRLRSILDRRQPDLTVLVEGLSKPHNVAAVMRTCDAVGIPEIHAVSAAETFKPSRASAAGIGRYVGVRTHPDLAAATGVLHDGGFQILAAHLTPSAVDYRDADYTRPTALLLGTELDGISAEAAALADGAVVIPMAGAVESLNVSVAAAVILYEAQRQRAAKGMYHRCRLDEDACQRLLFEWGYRRLAEMYRRRGEPYPRLGPDGEIVR
jgi:tRNA (guanosine-2'-O-)-methyltransferase